MPSQCIGKEVNKDLLDKINAELEKFISENKQSEETISGIPHYETMYKGEKIYLFEDKKEAYDTYASLLSLISFEKTSSDEVYEIPGIKIPNPEHPESPAKYTIYLPIQNAKLLAENAIKYRKQLKIEFPDELFQLYHNETKVPGTDYVAPLPKKYSESEEEYEERLEEEYEAHGVEKERLDGGEYRKPYPHEKVRYNNPTPEMTEIARDSYITRVREAALSSELVEPGGPGTPEDEQRRVTDVNRTLGQKLYSGWQTFKGVVASKVSMKRVLAIAGGTAMIGFGAITAPLPTLAVAGAGGVFLGVGYVIKKHGIPALKALKKKCVDYFKGPEIVETEPEHEHEYEREPEHTPTTSPEVTRRETPRVDAAPPVASAEADPLEIPDDLSYVLAEINLESEDIKRIEAQIAIKEEALTTASESEKALYESELNELKAARRNLYVNAYNLLQNYINNKTKATGGPSL